MDQRLYIMQFLVLVKYIDYEIPTSEHRLLHIQDYNSSVYLGSINALTDFFIHSL